MNVQEFYETYYVRFPKVSTDTRSITKNSIFIALKGDNFDGNKYAEKALELLKESDRLLLTFEARCYIL